MLSLEEFRARTWSSAGGEGKKIGEIDNGYLVNIINWVLAHSDRYSPDTLAMLEREAESRQLVDFANYVATPAKLLSGSWTVRAVDGSESLIPPPAKYYADIAERCTDTSDNTTDRQREVLNELLGVLAEVNAAFPK